MEKPFYQSDCSVFDNTFQFQLGVFEEVTPGTPFIPTEGNISLLSSQWRLFKQAGNDKSITVL